MNMAFLLLEITPQYSRLQIMPCLQQIKIHLEVFCDFMERGNLWNEIVIQGNLNSESSNQNYSLK